jgi:hypothetical protein
MSGAYTECRLILDDEVVEELFDRKVCTPGCEEFGEHSNP